jgi:hypothetical protein
LTSTTGKPRSGKRAGGLSGAGGDLRNAINGGRQGLPERGYRIS